MQPTVFYRALCRLLILAMLAMPFSPAMAGMIGTQDMVAGSTAQTNRATVTAALSRADVATQLQSHGIDLDTAKARVASMTDQEVNALAGQIDALPAGAVSGWAVAIIIGLLIWYFYK